MPSVAHFLVLLIFLTTLSPSLHPVSAQLPSIPVTSAPSTTLIPLPSQDPEDDKKKPKKEKQPPTLSPSLPVPFPKAQSTPAPKSSAPPSQQKSATPLVTLSSFIRPPPTPTTIVDPESNTSTAENVQEKSTGGIPKPLKSALVVVGSLFGFVLVAGVSVMGYNKVVGKKEEDDDKLETLGRVFRKTGNSGGNATSSYGKSGVGNYPSMGRRNDPGAFMSVPPPGAITPDMAMYAHPTDVMYAHNGMQVDYADSDGGRNSVLSGRMSGPVMQVSYADSDDGRNSRLYVVNPEPSLMDRAVYPSP